MHNCLTAANAAGVNVIEGSMHAAETGATRSGGNAVRKAVTDAVKRWMDVAANPGELAAVAQAVSDISRDLGLSPNDLRALSAKGADAAKELPCLLHAQGGAA
jgi:hypothetical protein